MMEPRLSLDDHLLYAIAKAVRMIDQLPPESLSAKYISDLIFAGLVLLKGRRASNSF